jgi:hypothetical protein
LLQLQAGNPNPELLTVMKRNFTNEDFEKFIRQQADQLRMRPSEKVWSAISGEMHRKRRWFGLVVILLFLSSASVTTYFLIHHATNGNVVARNTTQSSGTITKQNTHLPTTNVIPQTASSARTSIPDKKAPVDQRRSSRNNSVIVAEPNSETVNLLEPQTTENNFSFEGTYADSHPFGIATKKVTELEREISEPYTIESVTNSYKAKKSKLGWQFYFTPTVSYRKLTENKSYLRNVQQQPNNGTVNYAELYNVNDVVTHKPDIGLEVGAAVKYAVSKNVKLRGGLQFNMTHYDIKAFDNYVPQVATIALNTGRGVDSLNTVTKYRSMNGVNSSWLQNFYFQISAPVGVEVVLKGDEKVQFGVATTVQPTYILGERAYMISSDYQNYAKVPWLIRRWNVNTSFETFVSYSTGQLKWQVGPQVRYQLLSSFVNEYPVKENLFDFGLKVGIGLNK